MNGSADPALKLGYLVPEFPGQTHAFFWSEIGELESLGASVSIFSTRLPPKSLISHGWSKDAITRTTYFGFPRPSDMFRTAARLSLADLQADLRREGPQFLRDVTMCLAAANRLARHCSARGISHVHAHSCGRSALVAALANAATGLPYSVTLHGPLEYYGPGQRFKWRRAAFATVVTQKLLKEVKLLLGSDLPDRVVVQSMGVDLSFFSRSTPYSRPGRGLSVRLFSCGRLNPGKGHQDLISAVAILLQRGMDVQLNIAGEDDAGGEGFRNVLEEQIRAQDLENRVRLLGAVDHMRVKTELQRAHVFVLASWEEAIGVALMEAMSCEVPVVGTDTGGVRELVDTSCGALVEPRAPEQLAAAIEAIVEDPARAERIGRAGREKVARQFGSRIGAETILREIRAKDASPRRVPGLA